MTPTPDELAQKSKAWAVILACIVGGCACMVAAWQACGCSPAAGQPPAVTARAEARAAELAAKDAVVLGYKSCALAVGVLDGAPKEDLRAKCHAALDPAAAGVELGAQLVDAWDDAAAAAYACAMADVLGGLQRLEALLAKSPPVLEDALVLLRAAAPTCTRPPPPDVVTAPVDAPPPPAATPSPRSLGLARAGADAFLTDDALAAPVDAGGAS